MRALVRSSDNPIITAMEVPTMPPDIDDPSAVFNPGAVRWGGRYLLMLRVQTRGRRTHLVMAESPNGREFTVWNEAVHIPGLEDFGEQIFHVYDPRITAIGDECLVMFAADTVDGCRLGTARTRDFRQFELVGLGDHPDIRNGVIFPSRLGDRYLRLDRPNRELSPGEPASGDAIVLSESTDLVEWHPLGVVMRGRPRYWDERIGAGPPPIRTRQGWLLVYHGVATHFGSVGIYQAGVALLDLEDPVRLLGRSRDNVLEPREMYELVGQVPNVVFPSGMIVEEYDAEGFATEESAVRVYYGAADTSVCMATGTVGGLLAAVHGR
ncbi:MAG: glycoside hydrolase family 130 protein [Candidatus Palauibacterales bacterium]|nr:glycoside hydrolase family 130 protein [Candidatus Palauibacterales bacterium]MDP2483067.1 glycoside hydrolase family 130 protein [Candidatus Palauibacterales bacterium]